MHRLTNKRRRSVPSTTGCTISPILNLPRKQSLFHFPQIACIFRILRHSHGFFLCKPLSFLLPFTSLPFVHQLSNLHGFYVAHHNNVTPYLIPPFSPFSSSSYLHIPLAPPAFFPSCGLRVSSIVLGLDTYQIINSASPMYVLLSALMNK